MAADPGTGQAIVFAIAYLTVSFLLGLLVSQRLFPPLPPLVRLSAAFLIGLVLSGWLTFLLALALSTYFSNSVLLGAILATWYGAFAVWISRPRPVFSQFRLSTVELAIICLAFLFSVWLFDQALSYDHRRGDLTISHSTWGDFGLHLALLRSFAQGENLPPQYPFYAGELIHYHFGYDFIAGVLERLGLRLDLAFNLPAALGFTALLALLFELGRRLSGSTFGGALAAVLMPLGSSLAFRDYLQQWGYHPRAILEGLWHQASRMHIGPYDGNPISIHFTLNPYLNQRQLALAMALGIMIIYLIVHALHAHRPLTDKQAIGLGALLGLSFPLNGVLYLGVLAVAVALFLCFRRWRDGVLFIVPSIALALPAALLLSSGDRPTWHLGYVVTPLTVTNFLRYWWLNLGLLLVLVAAAAVYSTTTDLRFLAAFSAPFLVGNLVQLGPDLSGINHKLFNLWIALLTVYGGVSLWRLSKARLPRFPWLGPLLVSLLLPPLTFSGLIDLMVIKNERRIEVVGSHRPAAEWIAAQTPPRAVFLTAADLYLPPSYAGRRLYLGFPLFTAVAGYDVTSRLKVAEQIYRSSTRQEACFLLTSAGIDYVQVGPAELHPESRLGVHRDVWAQFRPAYDAVTPYGPLRYYRVAENC